MATNPLVDEARRQAQINQIPSTGNPVAPAADGSQNNPLNTDTGRAITNTLGALPGAGSIPGAAARGTSLMARAFGASQPALSAAGQAAAPYAPVAAGGVALVSAASADSPQPPAPAPSAMASAPVPSAPQSRPLMQAAFGDASESASPAASMPTTAQGGYTRIDQPGTSPLFTDGKDPSMASFMARPSGGPSAQNMAAADSLAGSQQAESMGRVQTQMAAEQEAQRNSPQALRQRALDTLATRQLGGRRSARMLMDAAAGMDREATTRSGNALVDRISLSRLGMEQQAAGLATRAAEQQEQLRNQVAQEQDPTKRRSLVQHMLDVSGKSQQADPYLVVPGGQNVTEDGKAYNTPSSVFNRQTGQFTQQPGQGGAVTVSSPQQLAALPSGAVYVAPDGKQYRKN